MTRAEALQIRESIVFQSNNCGGCETCFQVFGDKPDPTFDMQTVFEIISLYEDLLKEQSNADTSKP
jgi:hypothetical protein